VPHPIVVKVTQDEVREPFIEIYTRSDDVKRLVASVTVDLQAVFGRCYDTGPYAREIRYGADALIPSLPTDKAAWAAMVLQAAPG
jgi:Protein of unknown function (DUF4058)